MHNSLMPESYIAIALFFAMMFGAVMMFVVKPLFDNDNLEPFETVEEDWKGITSAETSQRIGKCAKQAKRKHGRSKRFGTTP